MRTVIATAATLALLVTSLAVAPVLAAAPIALDDFASTLEDTSVTIYALRNDSDPDLDTMSIATIANPPSGSAVLGPTYGTIVYTPDRDFNGANGPDVFEYTVTDTHGETDTALVTVYVTPVNDPPTAGNRTYTLAEDGSVEVLFVGMDPDKERCDLVFQVEHRTGVGNVGPLTDAGCTPNGDFATAIYTPFPGYNGPILSETA